MPGINYQQIVDDKQCLLVVFLLVERLGRLEQFSHTLATLGRLLYGRWGLGNWWGVSRADRSNRWSNIFPGNRDRGRNLCTFLFFKTLQLGFFCAVPDLA
jgi:hypothetical protein